MKKGEKLIIWSGTYFDAGGYAAMNRNYVKRLIDRGWEVKIEAIRSPHEISQEEINYFSSLGRGPEANWPIIDPVVEARNPKAKVPSPPDSIRIFAHLPITRLPKPARGKRIIFTMMECEKVNENFIHSRCNKYYEECWTPTQFNKKVFEEKGLNIPCKVSPIGIDPYYSGDNVIEDINFNLKSYGENAPEKPEGFVFLSVFRWSYRKGYDVLIKSFLKEFKKSDNVSLVIVSRHAAMSHDPKFRESVDFGIASEYQKYATADSPPIYWCGDVIPMDLMPSMYAMGDCFVSTSRGEGFCTLPDARIKTPEGVRRIKDIKKGDYVFSHKGFPEKVLNTFKREYDGKMVEISSYGRNNQKLTLTPNHRVFVLKYGGLYKGGVSKIINKSKFNFNEDKLDYLEKNHRNMKYKNYNFQWIDASQIERGDMLFYPKLKYEEKKEFIDLESIEKIKNIFNIRENRITSKIVNQTGECKGDGICSIDFKRIKITEEFMELAGYYISEGNSSSNNLNFTFNKKETKYHNHVKSLMLDIMGLKCGKDQICKHKESYNIVYNNVIIKEFFSGLFGAKARKKHLPNWAFSLDRKYLISLIKTLFRGDGNSINENTLEKSSYSTSSEELANNVFDILQRLGISSSIKKRKHKNKKHYEYGNETYSVVITNINDAINLLKNTENIILEVNKRKSHKIFLTDNEYQILKVKEVKEISYSGTVYNLHVDKDNTYICENIAVHNCVPVIEASTMGLPIIAPNHTGFQDYLTNDNSNLFEVDEWVVCNSIPEWKQWITFEFSGQNFPKFGDSSVDQVRSLMRDVKENPEKAAKKNSILQNVIQEKYSWDKCVDVVEDHLLKLEVPPSV